MAYIVGLTCPQADPELEGDGWFMHLFDDGEIEIDLSDPAQAEPYRRGVYTVVCPVCGDAFEVEL